MSFSCATPLYLIFEISVHGASLPLTNLSFGFTNPNNLGGCFYYRTWGGILYIPFSLPLSPGNWCMIQAWWKSTCPILWHLRGWNKCPKSDCDLHYGYSCNKSGAICSGASTCAIKSSESMKGPTMSQELTNGGNDVSNGKHSDNTPWQQTDCDLLYWDPQVDFLNFLSTL